MNAVTIAIAFVVGIVIGVDFACLYQRRSRIGHFAEGFRTERQGIESQCDRNDDIRPKILDVHSVAIARPLNACSPFSRTGLCEIPPL